MPKGSKPLTDQVPYLHSHTATGLLLLLLLCAEHQPKPADPQTDEDMVQRFSTGRQLDGQPYFLSFLQGRPSGLLLNRNVKLFPDASASVACLLRIAVVHN